MLKRLINYVRTPGIVFTVSVVVGLVAMGVSALSSNDEDAALRGGPIQAGGVIVYAKEDFDQDLEGFHGFKKVTQSLVGDAASGLALETISREKWAGPSLDFDVRGSGDLRMAFMAKGKGFERVAVNVFDENANDNTTPYAYRRLPDGKWRPVLYYLDRFRYNSKSSGMVSEDALYRRARFFSPKASVRDVRLVLDNFVIYRGRDEEPPAKVEGLAAHTGDHGIHLSWRQPEDNVFPMCYTVARSAKGGQFQKIAETFTTSHIDSSAGKGTFAYRIRACDFENNLGPWSEPVKAKSKREPTYSSLLQEQEDRLRYARHVRKVHAKGRGQVNKGRVLLYGDSLTKAKVYPQAVAAVAGIYQVEAKGYPGMRTGWGADNVVEKALEPFNPEFMFVLFGTNNVRGKMHEWDTMEEWVLDLGSIVEAAEARGTVVLLGTIPPRGFEDPASRPEAAFNELLVKRAREWQVPLAYIFEEIQSATDRKRSLSGDGIHWTSTGMEAAARAWGRALRQVEFALRE